MDENEQVRRVAEAARALRRHQLSILDVVGAGDLERQAWNDKESTLRSELDLELSHWAQDGRT